MSLRLLSAFALGLGLLFVEPAAAGAQALPGRTVKGTVSCGTVQKVVLCVVRLEPYPRSTIRYAEAVFAATPKFLRPIKEKTVYKPDPTKSPHLVLGLEPTGHGEGEVAVLVRSVSCHQEQIECSHQALTVRTRVSIPKP